MLENTGLSRAAARSEAIMSAALDTLEEAVTMNGPDGTTVYANQAAVRLLGATSAEEVVNGEPGAISARYRIYDEAGGRTTTATCPRSARSRASSTPSPSSCATSSWRPARSAGC